MAGPENNKALRSPRDAEAPATDRNGFGSRGWTVIWFQAVMFWLAAGSVTHGLNVTLPALSRTYGLDYNTLLLLATPASWASIPAGALCACACEMKGIKFNIVFCLMACGLCFGLQGYCGSFIGFTLLFAGVCFFGTGFAYVGGTALIASWFVRKQGLALGWCTVGQIVSSAFYVPTLAALFVWLGVRHGFWGISCLMFVMAALVQLFVVNKPEDIGLAPDNERPDAAAQTERHCQNDDSKYASPVRVGQLLRMRDVWFMGIGTGGIYIMLVGVTSQIVPRLMGMGYDQSSAIFYMTVGALCGVPATYGWGWLDHRIGIKRALLIYTAWWMVAVVLNMIAHDAITLWISLVMIGFSLPGATNLTTVLFASKFPRHLYVRAIGIIHPIQSVVRCCAFSILAFGLAHLGGYTGAYLLLVVVGAISLLLIWQTDLTPVDTGVNNDYKRQI